MSLSGRHALVCGASKGIGRATAIALAAQGARVTALARGLEALESLLPELGSGARALSCDLDDHAALSTHIGELCSTDPVHIVINNTGGPPGGPLIDAPTDQIHHALSRHLISAHLIMQAALPGMREAGYGRFVQILSTSVREPIDNLGVSNLTRAAVASWAKTLSRELPPGVTINNILPGFTDTQRLSQLAEAISNRTGKTVDDVYAGWRSVTPEGRLGQPQELAAAVAFLCSPSASFIRGVSLPVDGGRLRSI
jgi:3-oxoacyl-[acyl-carrier protein] reductase